MISWKTCTKVTSCYGVILENFSYQYYETSKFLTIQITVKNEFENLQKQNQTKKIEKCKKVLVPAIGQYF